MEQISLARELPGLGPLPYSNIWVLASIFSGTERERLANTLGAYFLVIQTGVPIHWIKLLFIVLYTPKGGFTLPGSVVMDG
jgi:hypothetical protein